MYEINIKIHEFLNKIRKSGKFGATFYNVAKPLALKLERIIIKHF